jgi:hypothetical protein
LGLGLFIHIAAVAASAIVINRKSVEGQNSSAVSVGSAALASCMAAAPSDIMLAQTGLRHRLRGKDAVLQFEAEGADSRSSTQMLKSISDEILAMQKELDDAHLACQADKKIANQKISRLDSSNSQVAQDVGSVEAKIAASAGELQPTTEKIQNLRDQIQKIRARCEKEGKEIHKIEEKKIRVMKAQRLETECRNSVRTMNDNLRERVSHLAKSQVALSQSIAMKAQFQQQMKEADAHMKRLMKTAEDKERDCQESQEQLQREMCGLVEMRQAIFWKFVSKDLNKVIQDCKVTDWTASQCDKACVDKDGVPGQQVLTRKVLMEGSPDPSIKNYGAGCPALTRTQTCNEGVQCPADCKMSEWSGWAKCSRECGGGEQYRTRSVLEHAKANGAVCGITAESALCNVGACQPSCTFAVWGPWSPCSKRCRWSEDTPAGHTSRKRAVAFESKPGACKDSDARQLQECNANSCPHDPSNLKCTSPQDILVVLDGSESAESEDGSAFKKAKGLVEDFVHHSSFSGDGDILRYALLVFGGDRTEMVSPMVGNQASLLEKLEAASFRGGDSNVAEALSMSIQVSQLATAGERPLRRETLFLVTGSSLRANSATATAAKRVRDLGIRVIVLQVAEVKDPVVNGDESECQIASAPCADNWLRVGSWDELSDQDNLGYYLSTVCPS